MHSHIDLSNRINRFLEKARFYFVGGECLRLFLTTILYYILAGTVIVIFNWLVEPQSSIRAVLLALYILFGIFIFVSKFVPLVLSTRKLRTIAIMLEHMYPQLNTKLIAGYDLKSENASYYGYSTALVNRAIERAAEAIRTLDYRVLFPKKAIVKSLRLNLIVLLIIAALCSIFSNEFMIGLKLTFNPFLAYTRPPKTILVVSPGDIKIPKMGELKVTIRAQGEQPKEIKLFRKHEGISPVEFRLRQDSTGVFSYTFKEIRIPFEYFAEANGFVTRRYKVSVVDMPQILSFQITIIPPSYTGLVSEKLEKNNGNMNILYGSVAEFSIKASKKVSRAYLLFMSDSTKAELGVIGDSVFGRFSPKKEDLYEIHLVDRDGNTNPYPIPYRIRIYRDEFPVVRIVSPAADVNVTEEMRLDLAISAEDDYGFSSFYIRHRRIDDTTKIGSLRIPFKDFGKRRVDLVYSWDLSELRLVPDEVVSYWIEAYDNDVISGPKLARSREYAIRLPSLEEIIEQVAAESGEQTRDFVKALQEEKKLLEEAKKFSQELLGKEELRWEDKQKATEIVKKQEEIKEKLSRVSEEMAHTLESMEKNALVAAEVIEKIQEIQRILEDIMTPELRAAIEQIRSALENMDPNLLRQAMKLFEKNVEELLMKLDQTLTLLKRVQIEQRLESLMKLASRLKDEQDKINSALNSPGLSQDSLSKLASAEDKINRGIDNLKENLAEVVKSMEEFPDMPTDAVKEILSNLEKGDLQAYAMRASSNMRTGQQRAAAKEGEKVSEGLSELLGGLSGSLEGLKMTVKKEILDAMRKVMLALFYTSNNTEDLYLGINPSIADDKSLSAGAERANRIDDNLKNILNDLYDIGGKTFLLSPAVGAFLGKARESLGNSVKQFSSRNAIAGRSSIMDALAFQNAAIEELMKSMESVSSASSGSGMESFFEQLQKMCNAQGELNMATIPFLGSGGSGLTPEQQATLARLAAQQEALRKSLEELQQEYERYANLRAKFDDVLKDMEQVVRDLQEQNVNEETINRQYRIHSRMLDAQRSLQRQDFTEKRESKTGKDIIRAGPSALPEDLGEKKSELKEKVTRALSEPYPREYDKQIKAYFRKLEELNK